jgi:stage III sporulation protein AD
MSLLGEKRMDIMQIVGLGIIATVLAIVLKEQKPVFSFLIAIVTGIIIFLFVVDKVADVIFVLEKMVFQAQLDMVFLETVLKIIGISYIAEFGAQITRDAGEGAIASKIELGGKIIIMILAIPIIQAIVETVLQLLPA